MKNQKGMALVELMVAVVILSLVIITMFSMYDVGFSIVSKSEKETQAIHLAQRAMEEIKLMLNTTGDYDVNQLRDIPEGYEYYIPKPFILDGVWHIKVTVLYDQNKRNLVLETRLGVER